MVTAARIFGDQVGSTAPVFLAFLAVHVLAGLTAVITGAVEPTWSPRMRPDASMSAASLRCYACTNT